jgi:hypothetical protein
LLTLSWFTRALITAILVGTGVLAGLAASAALSSGDPVYLLGDTDCDEDVDAHDALNDLLHTADLSPAAIAPCVGIGEAIPAGAGIPGPQGPAGPTGPVGPAGPQGLPGVTQFASVNDTGQLLAGTATAATRIQQGAYRVTFPMNVTECAPIVTPGSVDFGSTSFTYVATQIASGLPDNVVHVGFVNHDSDSVDTGFHLVLVC